MNTPVLDVDTLLNIAEEYQTKGIELALKNDSHVSATLINQSIIVYTFLVDKHDDPQETGVYLSFEKLMHCYLKLIELLVKYTMNWKLAKKVTQKAILKIHELTEKSLTDDQREIWCLLHMFYYYTIPTKIQLKGAGNASEMKQAYQQLDHFIQTSTIATDWRVIFSICQISFFFKLDDTTGLELLDTFNHLENNMGTFKANQPDVFIYTQLCKACYYLSINNIDMVSKVFAENGGENNIEKLIHNPQLLMSFYLIWLYKDLLMGVRSSSSVGKIHRLLISNKKSFLETKVFEIKSGRSSINCEISLLEYSLLKDLLLFFQGINYLDKGSIDLQRDMGEMFFKRISKGKNKNHELRNMIAFYRKWQDEVIFGFEGDGYHEANMEFPYAYMKFIQMETPTIEAIDQLLNKYADCLEMPRYGDMVLNLKLQRAVLVLFKDDKREEPLGDTARISIDETFEDTRTAVMMVHDRRNFDTSTAESNSHTILTHNCFLKNLNKISSEFKENSYSEKNGFLVVIFSILKIDVEDNLNEKFTKYYSIIKGLLINDKKRIFPSKFWIQMINHTIAIGTQNNESEGKIEELKKLSETLQ